MAELAGHMADANVAEAGAKPRRRWQPADLVVGFSTALIVIIFAVFGFLCWQGYGTTLANAKTKAQTATDIVAQNVDLTIDGGHAALSLIAAQLPDPQTLTGAQKAAFDAAVKTVPGEPSLAIYDAAGALAPNGGTPATPPSLAGTPVLSALASGSSFVVLPQGKDAASGGGTIEIAQRLGVDTMTGVALLSFPASILKTFWAPQRLGTDSTVNIHLENGDMVGRYPPLPEPVNASTSPNWPAIEGAETGTYTTVSPIDQVRRVVGFRHIRDLGVVVFATVSLDAAVGGLWTSIIIVTLLIAPIGLALLVGSLMTARILRRSQRTQASLAAAVTHNEMLFREIHHRVKNNLQSVGALLQMQPIPKEIKADMSQRIAAMSAVHEHIYRSNNFSTVRVKDYLATLIENIRAGHDPRVRVVEALEDVSVDKDAAAPLGLILNEVVSNAFKHAFKDGREGVVTVTLRRLEDGRGCLTVDDNGAGFDPAAPAKGIGRRLIAGLTTQLNGQSDVTSGPMGSRFSLTFPLAEDSPRAV